VNPGQAFDERDLLYDQIVFASSLVGNCLVSLRERDGVVVMLNKAIEFLESQKEEPGIWRWHGLKDADPNAYLPWPPDVDDTAMSYILYAKMGRKIPAEILDLLEQYKNEQGLMRTWMVDRWWPDTPKEKQPVHTMVALQRMLLHSKEYARYVARIPEERLVINFRNEIDEVVQANLVTLFSLTQSDYKHIASYINEVIKNKQFHSGSFNYSSPRAFVYFVIQALQSGADSLSVSSRRMEEYLLNTQKSEGEWGNSLETAIAVTCLLRLNSRSEAIRRGIRTILDSQTRGGWWKAECFFWPRGYGLPTPYYGSRAITTAFCLEALQEYAEQYVN